MYKTQGKLTIVRITIKQVYTAQSTNSKSSSIKPKEDNNKYETAAIQHNSVTSPNSIITTITTATAAATFQRKILKEKK